MRLRRRGGRGARERSRGGSLLARVEEVRGLGLRELRPLAAPDGTPDEVELGAGLDADERSVAIAVGTQNGPALVGFGHVAASLTDDPHEIVVAAPAPTSAARRAAAGISFGWPVRLVALPALADAPDVYDEERFPPASRALGGPAGGLLDRIVRVVEGAAVVTGVGAVRGLLRGYVLYLRGVPVLDVSAQGDGVGVRLRTPERRLIHVTESSFPRWGVELQETISQLAQDPRLLEHADAQRESEAAAAAAGARLTARWLPWNEDGSDPVDWVGVDDAGRAVLGWQRSSFGLADVPAVTAALQTVRDDVAAWAPGSTGGVRLVTADSDPDRAAAELLARAGISIDGSTIQPASRPVVARAEPSVSAVSEREPGRRRSRRRRRPSPDPSRDSSARGADAERQTDPDSVELPAAEPAVAPVARQGSEGGAEGGREPRRRPRRGRRGGRSRSGRARGEEAAEPSIAERADVEPSDVEEGPVLETAGIAADDERTGSDAPIDVSAEEPALAEGLEVEEEAAPEPEPAPRVVRRRARAAICVRNEPDSILAALVLARERRHVPFFWVCAQEELMDFFRGKATDLDDATDLLLVGFTGEPIARELIDAAGIYNGRIQWFDHHEWPVEDAERLREAIGEDAVVLAEESATPLACVMELAERRSRFTDKLVDLSGRRLSEPDMEKWGYRLVGLIERLRASTGDHRTAISAILAGKPAELPSADDVYRAEQSFIEEHDPRIVHFGEYQMAVMHVPSELDAGEVGRRIRLKTGARLSLSSRVGDELVLLGCNEEKRHLNVLGLVEQIASRVPGARTLGGGDRIGRVRIDGLVAEPERLERVIGEIARNQSILYG